MKARIRATEGLCFDVEAEQEDELFKQIARIQEIFQHQGCGACGSTNIKFVCRLDNSDNDWLEITCQDCRAKLVFGRTKKGGLIFPKIKWNQLSEKQQEQRKAKPKTAKGYFVNGSCDGLYIRLKRNQINPGIIYIKKHIIIFFQLIVLFLF